jgi:hypothetical protein
MLRNPVETDKGGISNCVKNRSKNSRHAGGKGGRRIVNDEGVKLKGWWMCWQECKQLGCNRSILRTDLRRRTNDING